MLQRVPDAFLFFDLLEEDKSLGKFTDFKVDDVVRWTPVRREHGFCSNRLRHGTDVRVSLEINRVREVVVKNVHPVLKTICLFVWRRDCIGRDEA